MRVNAGIEREERRAEQDRAEGRAARRPLSPEERVEAAKRQADAFSEMKAKLARAAEKGKDGIGGDPVRDTH